MRAIGSLLSLGMLLSSLVLSGGDAKVSALLEERPVSELLKSNELKFHKYSGDFRDFTKGMPSTSADYAVATGLQTVAQTVEDELHAVSVFVEIHDITSCAEDRTKIEKVIHREALTYSERTGSQELLIVALPVSTRRPQIKVEAGQMRDDLTKTANLLRTIELHTFPQAPAQQNP
jgi:glutamine cyclotransferase